MCFIWNIKLSTSSSEIKRPGRNVKNVLNALLFEDKSLQWNSVLGQGEACVWEEAPEDLAVCAKVWGAPKAKRASCSVNGGVTRKVESRAGKR